MPDAIVILLGAILLADIARAFGSAELGAAFSANLQLLRLKALQLICDGAALSILSMFLLGALIGKLRLYRDLSGHRRLLARTFWICAPIGITGNAALTPLHAATPDFPPTAAWAMENTLYALAVPAMAVAYASGFALIWTRGWSARLRLLAPAGRMALTTYISRTLIGVTLFYSVGLGLHGRVGLAERTALAVVIFSVQCRIASLWLRSFNFGPIEWVWRRFTYGKPIALLREAGVR